eukprot:1805072-Pleurochrysis_carterae.AAC.1
MQAFGNMWGGATIKALDATRSELVCAAFQKSSLLELYITKACVRAARIVVQLRACSKWLATGSRAADLHPCKVQAHAVKRASNKQAYTSPASRMTKFKRYRLLRPPVYGRHRHDHGGGRSGSAPHHGPVTTKSVLLHFCD